MKRVGTFLIWLACGMVFCAISRADNAVNPNTAGSNADLLNQIRQATSAQDRLLLMKKLRAQEHLPFPQTAQPGNPQLNNMQPRQVLSSNAPARQVQPYDSKARHVQPDEAPASSSQTDAPYGSIAVRNVFGLNPIPPPQPLPDPNAIPPPKITLTGITTIFGPAEALYKVAAYNKNGKQVPEQSYILTEGEAQDEVEVTKIDADKDIVTFNNHSQTQVIPLANGVATGGDSGAGAPRGAGAGFSRPRFGGFGGQPNFNNLPPDARARFQQRYGNTSGFNQNNNNFNPAGQNNYNNNNTGLSADDNEALIAAQHAAAANDPNSPIPPQLFPPTKYDPEAGIPPGAAAPQPGQRSAPPIP